MARPVYSTRFIAAATNAEPVSYTVPPGFTAVVHCLTAWCTIHTASQFLVAGAAGVAFFVWAPADLYDYTSWDGRLVLNEGEDLELNPQSDAMHLTASGYLLAA